MPPATLRPTPKMGLMAVVCRRRPGTVLTMGPCLSVGSDFQLHSENAEFGSLDRRVVGGGDAETDGHAGVDRVEDAVVPEASRAVVGAALTLVRFKGRAFELVLLLGGEAFSALSELVEFA